MLASQDDVTGLLFLFGGAVAIGAAVFLVLRFGPRDHDRMVWVIIGVCGGLVLLIVVVLWMLWG